MSIYRRLFLWFFVANIATLLASIVIAYAIFERRVDRAPAIADAVTHAQLALDRGEAFEDKDRDDGHRLFLIRDGRQLDGSPPPRFIARHFEDLLTDGAELRLPRGTWLVSRRLAAPHEDTHLILLQGPPRPRPWHRAVVPALQILLSVLVIAGVGWIVARHLARPLQHIQTAVRAVTAGQLDSRVGDPLTSRRDEYGALARDFDRMAAQIQALVSSRDQLLHDVSHELRAPLSRLRFALELAHENPQRAAFERADREIARIDALVGQLLTLARLEQPLGRENAQPVDLQALVAEVVEAETPQARHRGVELQVHAVALSASGDAEALTRALENLVRNAVRHSPAGTVVEVCVETIADDAVLRVRDRGPGVPAEDLPRLFEPFFRSRGANTTESADEGHGLGLAIVARILRAHRGRAEARRRDGGGLEVSLRWPRSIDRSIAA